MLYICGKLSNGTIRVHDTITDSKTTMSIEDALKSPIRIQGLHASGSVTVYSDVISFISQWLLRQRLVQPRVHYDISYFNSRIVLIGCYASVNSSELMTLEIPDFIDRVDDFVFSEANFIEGITFKNPDTVLGESCFGHCDSIKYIKLPERLKVLPYGCFMGCISLEHVILPDSVESLGCGCFHGCSSLRDIRLPNSLEVLEDYCFFRCTSLQSISLPDSVSELGTSVFGYSTRLTRVVLSKSLKVLPAVFQGCTALRSVEFNNGLTKIDARAFCSSNLDCLELPDTVTDLGENLFKSFKYVDCEAPKRVRLSKSLIGEDWCNAFKYCDEIEELIMPEGLRAIDMGVFANCAVRELKFPRSITTIDNCDSLSKMPNLQSVTVYKDSLAHDMLRHIQDLKPDLNLIILK